MFATQSLLSVEYKAGRKNAKKLNVNEPQYLFEIDVSHAFEISKGRAMYSRFATDKESSFASTSDDCMLVIRLGLAGRDCRIAIFGVFCRQHSVQISRSVLWCHDLKWDIEFLSSALDLQERGLTNAIRCASLRRLCNCERLFDSSTF